MTPAQTVENRQQSIQFRGRQRQPTSLPDKVIDKRAGRAIEAKAIMEGRLGKIEADAFQRGELMGHEYAVNEITHYELWFDEKEKIAWDFYTNTWRVNGVDENADTNRILRVPATL